MFSDTFPGIAEMDVLDLGGETRIWRTAPVRPRHVTVLNTSTRWLKEPDDWMTIVHQDACDPHIDGRYDLVYSNSVIEHVGGVYRRLAFAANVQRLAPRHWIQTPY